MSNNKSASGGIGFTGLLAIVFITLKLTGHIDWSWWWVLLPLWGPIGIIIGVALLIGVFWLSAYLGARIFGLLARAFSKNKRLRGRRG